MSSLKSSSEHGDLFAVVPAAGSGSRMNSDTAKQYIEVNGLPILTHTVNRLLQIESIKKIVVVLDEVSYKKGTDKLVDNPRVTTCIGGAVRAESVSNGLTHIGEHIKADAISDSSVLVHDAARPCVRVDEIHHLIAQTAGDVNGGLLAMPVTDTIKRSDDSDRVTETVDRSMLWRAATPQLFPFETLVHALSKALEEGVNITDEASAMQYAGYSPKLVECSADNIKVTTSTDLVLAEHYLSAQRNR